jgi:ELWxxDGT repeat protein
MHFKKLSSQKWQFSFLLVVVLLFYTDLVTAQARQIGSFSSDSYGGLSISVQAGNIIFFSANTQTHGRELWRTDGTEAGTYMVADINPGLGGSIIGYFESTSHVMNGIIYFRADNGVNGIELWRSDGTTSGTYMVADIVPGSGSGAPGGFTHTNNLLFFTAGTGSSLWRSDGTSAGTYSIGSFQIVTNLTGFNGNVYFSADINNSGQELWKSNGTAAGTQLLKDLNGVFGASLPCNFHVTPNILYFMANTNDGWELWKTTGSNASTVQVKDINPGGAGSVLSVYSVANAGNIGNTLYFSANDGVTGYQLWKSDGTDTGTVRISNLPNGVDQNGAFPVVNGKVLVNNYASEFFWQYDPVTDIFDESSYPSRIYFNSYGGKYLFSGNEMFYADKDSVFGCEIFYADGNAGTSPFFMETHLTDNWFSSATQGFNTILGISGNNLVYSQSRSPYNAVIPLFSVDHSASVSCSYPSVIFPVPLSFTSAHFVWSYIPDASQYELQYRLLGNPSWNSEITAQTYVALNSLSDSADYEYRIRAFCNGNWTTFSDIKTYNSGLTVNDYILHILADKSENDSTHRIYWLKTPQITNMQIRYRVAGTTTWQTISNSNGYRRITGLTPNTFYEYQWRANWSGTWDQWFPSTLYFYTRGNSLTDDGVSPVAQNELNIFPNPVIDKLHIPAPDGSTYRIVDTAGRVVSEGSLSLGFVNVSHLTPGLFIVLVYEHSNVSSIKILKQ